MDGNQGARVRWRSRITPGAIIAAGFGRKATRYDRKALEVNGSVPDFTAFCKAAGCSRNLYFQVQKGTKAPTETFRLRVSRALNMPESELFERLIEG